MAGHPCVPSGEQVILRLFVALAVATAVILLLFAAIAPEAYRLRIYVALVGNLLLAAVVYAALRQVGKRRRQIPLDGED